MSFVTDILALSHVPRWSIVAHTRGQSVSDHSFRVAIIADEIRRRHNDPKLRQVNILWGALVHDVDECVTGDIPGPAKALMRYNRDHPKLVDTPEELVLTLDEIKLLKVADIIDAHTFIARWGVGPHAESVAMDLMHKFRSLVEDRPYKTEATHLHQEILLDFGRFRG